MRAADRARALGPAALAESRARGLEAALKTPPPADCIELHLRPVLAPALQRYRENNAFERRQSAA